MRKNDRKVTSQRPQAVVMRGLLALVLVGLLVVPVVVQAELKATSLAYTWDYLAEAWEWGHATIFFDGEWIPLLQEVYFDGLDGRDLEPGEPDICSDGMTHLYSGWIEYGLPRLDNDPEDARGFRASKDWVLIDCDLNGDGTWDRDDLTVEPEDVGPPLATCSEADGPCQIPLYEGQQYPEYVGQPWWDLDMAPPAATSEHCAHELSTMLIINLDRDCDGAVDPEAAHLLAVHDMTGLCVYSLAQTPLYGEGETPWSFPLPVRITDADGAKTLMLYPDPTAIELASFNAEPQGRNVLVWWETAAEIDNVGFNLYRSEAGGERVRLNNWLIPSQSPGSAAGFRYQFLDSSAEPDTAYQYWLEDIDLAGAAGMNGPLAVQTPRHRYLPCRPRPAPMPQSQ